MHRERRRWTRIDVQIETRVSLRGVIREGTTRNISLGGLYMVVPGGLSIHEQQAIQVGLVTEAGVLELRGTVRGFRELIDRKPADAAGRRVGFAVKFEALEDTRARVLASLLEGLREKVITMTVQGLLAPQEAGGFLVEVAASHLDTRAHPGRPIEAAPEDPLPAECRLVPRVDLAVPVRLEVYDQYWKIADPHPSTMNLSVVGACLRLRGRPVLPGQRLMLRLSLGPLEPWAPGRIGQPALPLSSGGGAECVGICQVVWAAEEPPAEASGVFRIGVRFLHHSETGQQAIAHLVQQALSASAVRGEDGWEQVVPVVSTPVECRNPAGRRIAASLDCPREVPAGTPVVVIAPGYGETQREYLELAYTFAAAGCQVLRYDHTNHVGESEGEMAAITLSGMREDLETVLEFVQAQWPQRPVAVVAAGLAGRVALKTAAEDRRVSLWVLLEGVLDLQATLLAVHQEDLIVKFLRGMRLSLVNVLGFNIEADHFLSDAIRGRYADLRGTIQDATQGSAPVVLFAAGNDQGEQTLASAIPGGTVRVQRLPEPLPMLLENPRKAQRLFQRLVQSCLEPFRPGLVPRTIRHPDRSALHRQTQREREQAAARHRKTPLAARACRQEYREHLQHLAGFPQYWHLLDQIYRLLGTLERGARLLDAGCGQGAFATFLIMNQAYGRVNRAGTDAEPVPYTGVDDMPDRLPRARANFRQAAAEMAGLFPHPLSPQALLQGTLIASDLNRPLPFRTGSFQYVICNLLLGALDDPLFTLGEFLRVLSPQGRLVVTTFKPRADLSRLSRELVRRAERPEDLEQARQLLAHAGRLMQGAREERFRCFERQELAMLLITGGAVRPRLYSTFANQVYIAVAEKP